jgi:hypothetical protein
MSESMEGMIREPGRQSDANRRATEMAEAYWSHSPGSVSVKLENFTKYVTRESLTKFLVRSDVFRQQLEVHGSVVELGVARGISLMTWAHLSAIYEPTNYNRRIIGFDTFTGFPAIHEKDAQGTSWFLREGGFEVEQDMQADIEHAVEILDTSRFLGHIPKVELVAGDIMETVPKYIEEHPELVVSLLHLDADLYAPTKLALEQIVPRMPKGAIILFDELNMKEFPGETVATIEALGLHTLRLRRFPHATCMSYAVIE